MTPIPEVGAHSEESMTMTRSGRGGAGVERAMATL